MHACSTVASHHCVKLATGCRYSDAILWLINPMEFSALKLPIKVVIAGLMYTYGCRFITDHGTVTMATQETQLSLTNRATHLYKCNGVAGCKHKYRRTPKLGEFLNSAVLGWEAWLTLKQAPSHRDGTGSPGHGSAGHRVSNLGSGRVGSGHGSKPWPGFLTRVLVQCCEKL